MHVTGIYEEPNKAMDSRANALVGYVRLMFSKVGSLMCMHLSK